MTHAPTDLFEDLDPEPRLLMGPGPVNVYPRVLRAMSVPLQGQFDPQFTQHMAQAMALWRGVFRTQNTWTMMIDGSARAGIEACLTSMVAPGDKVLVPIFGRFGHLLVVIARRARGDVVSIETDWGTVFTPDAWGRSPATADARRDSDHPSRSTRPRRPLE
jgi:(S)-ureidoglycine-glyoxylate aminotransferase